MVAGRRLSVGEVDTDVGRTVLGAKKRQLYDKLGRKCFYCNEVLDDDSISLEHLHAKSKGGTNREENLILLCEKLNKALGRMSKKEKLFVLGWCREQGMCCEQAISTVHKHRQQRKKKGESFIEGLPQTV